MWERLRVPVEDFPQAVLFQPVPLHLKMLRLQELSRRDHVWWKRPSQGPNRKKRLAVWSKSCSCSLSYYGVKDNQIGILYVMD